MPIFFPGDQAAHRYLKQHAPTNTAPFVVLTNGYFQSERPLKRPLVRLHISISCKQRAIFLSHIVSFEYRPDEENIQKVTRKI